MGFYQCIAYQWLACFTSSCFQARIIVGWTQYSEAGSAKVLSPAKAAITTCALNSALRCFFLLSSFTLLSTGQPQLGRLSERTWPPHIPLGYLSRYPFKTKGKGYTSSHRMFSSAQDGFPALSSNSPCALDAFCID